MSAGIYFIAVFEILKGLGALGAAIGLFDVIETKKIPVLRHFISHSHPESFKKFLTYILGKIKKLSDYQAWLILLFGILYSLLRFLEGYGLFIGEEWGRQIGIWSAFLYLPFEAVEIFHRFSWPKILITFINVLVIIYLWNIK